MAIDVSKLNQRQLRMEVGHYYDSWQLAEKVLKALTEGRASTEAIEQASRAARELKQDYEAIRGAIK